MNQAQLMAFVQAFTASASPSGSETEDSQPVAVPNLAVGGRGRGVVVSASRGRGGRGSKISAVSKKAKKAVRIENDDDTEEISDDEEVAPQSTITVDAIMDAYRAMNLESCSATAAAAAAALHKSMLECAAGCKTSSAVDSALFQDESSDGCDEDDDDDEEADEAALQEMIAGAMKTAIVETSQ